MYKSYSVGDAFKAEAESLVQMIFAPCITHCIYAAAKLGIADLLKDGSKQTHELAVLTETHEPSLYRVLRALASMGIFSEIQPKCFQLTPMAQLLRSDVADSLRAFYVSYGSDLIYKPWGKILYSIKTGKPAFDHIFNMPFFDYFKQDSIAGRVFDEAMTALSSQSALAIAGAYDFSKMKSIVDVGGGNGMLLGMILKANPHLKGILFDLPEVIERARDSDYLTTEISSGRCQLIPGNFFETVPDGADAYLMNHIIHDWNSDQSIKILNNCYKAMAEKGKLILIEHVVPPGNEPGLAKIADIAMLVLLTGFERTEDEFNTLLQTAGFSKARLFNILTTPLCVIESARAKDLVFRLDQTSKSKQGAPIEELEVRNREAQVASTRKAVTESLVEMISTRSVTQCIYAAAKLGIADLLKDGSKQTHELAALTETHETSLYRVLRALASMGIFSEIQPRCFELTPIAQLLRSDVPDSLRALSIYSRSDIRYKPWGKILYSVKTGKPAFDHIFNMPFFDYLKQDSIAGRVFDEAITALSSQCASVIAAAYDFSKMKSIVDVGGGNGMLLGTILKANPHLKGILFDLPEVIERAKDSDYLTTEISSGRCQLIPGNFFETVPDGADAYLLKHIIHNWNSDQSIKILNNCYKAMAENGKLLLIEHVVPPGNEPGLAKIIDIDMLVLLTGFERTDDEFNTLLQTAGFSKARPCNILKTSLRLIESARAKDLVFRLDQTSESKQEAAFTSQ